MNMKNHPLAFVLVAVMAPFLGSAELVKPGDEINLRSVSFRQDLSTRDLVVDYEFSGTNALIRAEILTNGVPIAEEHFRTITGDYSHSASETIAAGGHQFRWKTRVDWPDNVSTNMQVRINAFYAEEASLAGFTYLVIDLSGGPDATHYPVASFDAPPVGGWSDEHKTTKLVLRRVKAGGVHGAKAYLGEDVYVGVFEITQRQWELVMGDRPSFFNNPGGYPSRPVEQVSYNRIRGEGTSSVAQWGVVGAESFLGRLRSKTGVIADLPNLAQWRYLCQGGTETDYNSGKNCTAQAADQSCPNMEEVGRYKLNGGFNTDPGCWIGGGTAWVGSYVSNIWGLYDFHGNVWELVLDNFPGYEPQTYVCGGSFMNQADECKWTGIWRQDPAAGSYITGFRILACTR